MKSIFVVVLVLVLAPACVSVPDYCATCEKTVVPLGDYSERMTHAWTLYGGVGEIDWPFIGYSKGDCVLGPGFDANSGIDVEGQHASGVTVCYESTVYYTKFIARYGWPVLAHELMHAALARHYGDLDVDHTRLEWSTLVPEAQSWVN